MGPASEQHRFIHPVAPEERALHSDRDVELTEARQHMKDSLTELEHLLGSDKSCRVPTAVPGLCEVCGKWHTFRLLVGLERGSTPEWWCLGCVGMMQFRANKMYVRPDAGEYNTRKAAEEAGKQIQSPWL